MANALSTQLAHVERFSTLGKMAAQIAHEIRNPAGAMRLKAEMRWRATRRAAKAALRTIIEQVGRIESRWRACLRSRTGDGSRSRGRSCPLAVSTHMNLVLRAAMSNQYRTEPGDARPVFDPAQLARALDNLIMNALRHAPVSSSVTVRAHHVLSQEGERLIEVVDNGPGVNGGA